MHPYSAIAIWWIVLLIIKHPKRKNFFFKWWNLNKSLQKKYTSKQFISLLFGKFTNLVTFYVQTYVPVCGFLFFQTSPFLLSLTHVMVRKTLFLGQIFEMEILMNLYVLRSPESENDIFSVWSMCLCLCLLSA